ncbi:hypothetical protein BC830DRAFT_433485 [Chytriomyces sp. MP71]|nr:hypothetical protein BC830DRAFT_433485 [Chytriomyces sp. MP71]
MEGSDHEAKETKRGVESFIAGVVDRGGLTMDGKGSYEGKIDRELPFHSPTLTYWIFTALTSNSFPFHYLHPRVHRLEYDPGWKIGNTFKHNEVENEQIGFERYNESAFYVLLRLIYFPAFADGMGIRQESARELARIGSRFKLVTDPIRTPLLLHGMRLASECLFSRTEKWNKKMGNKGVTTSCFLATAMNHF